MCARDVAETAGIGRPVGEVGVKVEEGGVADMGGVNTDRIDEDEPDDGVLFPPPLPPLSSPPLDVSSFRMGEGRLRATRGAIVKSRSLEEQGGKAEGP